MDEEIERLVIGIRADTSAFNREVSAMRGELDGPLTASAQRAGRMIEASLARAVSTGKFGFDDLRQVALSALGQIAQASVRSLFSSGAQGGLGPIAGGLTALLSGLPGRATGGPVSAGRPYLVGERGPELFVPGANGRVEASSRGSRDIRITLSVNGGANPTEPQALRRSSRQVARAIRASLLKDIA